ncbi:hypothetical protein DZ11F43_46150 [Escherichia coli]
MLPSETMIWQPEFTDKTLSRKPGAVQIAENHVYPAMIRMDYGQEFFDPTRTECAEKHVVKLEITQSGKLAQNAFIESFNRTYRTKILGFCLFRTLDEKRELVANWLSEYNSERHINHLTI